MSTSGALLLFAAVLSADDSSRAIDVDSVVVTLIQQVDVPARERGELTVVAQQEGQLVTRGQELAKIDDAEAVLSLNHAQLDLDRAQAEAKNTVKIELAKKTLAVAQLELERGQAAIDRFKRALSDSELDRLKLEVDRAKLALEQAEREHEIAQYDWRVAEAVMQLATRQVERRAILAPIAGMVVQVHRHPGEWVEPGESVFRIVQLDRLRVEGFLDAEQVVGDLTGRAVTLVTTVPGRGEVQFAGTLRFVSPEIDPVDGKVRVWAEIENRDLLLRPGFRGAMTIEPRPSE